MTHTSTPIFDRLREFFDAEDLTYNDCEKNSIVGLRSQGANGTYRVLVEVNEEYGYVEFYTICDMTIVQDRRNAVAELIARINSTRIIGAFLLDFSDGELQYHTSIEVSRSHESLTDAMLQHLIDAGIFNMDRYFPVIEKLNGDPDLCPEQAFEKAQAAFDAPGM